MPRTTGHGAAATRRSSSDRSRLGRPEQPVGGIQAGGRRQRGTHVLPGQGPGGLEDEPVIGVDAEGVADRLARTGTEREGPVRRRAGRGTANEL